MLLIAVAGALLFVSGTNGAAIASAQVTFVDGARRAVVATSDARGAAQAPAAFDAVRAHVLAGGFEPADVVITAAIERVTLRPKLPVIVSVNVATGSAQSLHTLPVAAAALDRSTIGLSAAPATDAVLRALPGFDPVRSNSSFTNYGQLRASFSGAGSDRGLVLVDGVPAQDGFGGQIDWTAYPSSDLVFAELLQGAGSALYGNGAIGGVLDLHTYAPDFSSPTPQAAAGANAGSNAYSQEWIDARTGVAPRLGAAVAMQQQRASYFDLPSEYSSARDHAAISRSGMADVQLSYKVSASDVLRIDERVASDVQDEGRANYSMTRRLNQFSARYNHARDRGAIAATFFARNAFIVNVADQFPAKPGALRYVQDVPTTESGTIVQWSVDAARSSFAARADARWIRGATYQHGPTGSLQSGVFGRQNLGGFALQETFRSDRTETVLGVRLDRVVLPRGAVRYALTPQWNVRASAGTGFREPFLNELLRSYVIGAVRYNANRALSAERSWTASVGADWTSGSSRLCADYWHTAVSDAIMFRTVNAGNQQRSNIRQTQTDGVTLTFEHGFNARNRIEFYATQQLARVTQGPADIVGKQLQFVPRSSGTIAYQTLAGHFQAGIDVSYLGRTYADDLNRAPLGTALVGDARVLIPVAPGLAIAVSASNVFSARYRSSIDRWGMPPVLTVGIQSPL